MDQSKQNLSPELKEVYDRVMNTTAKPAGVTPASSQTPTPVQATPAAATVQVETQTSTPANESNVMPTPTMVTTTVQTPAASSTPTPPAANGNMPTGTPAPTAFVFNGNKMTSDGKTAEKAKKKIPGFLIPIGVIILIIAWAAIWAKVFGLF